MSPLRAPVMSRVSRGIDVALASGLFSFANLKEVLNKNLLALRKFINRVIVLSFTNLDKDFLHRLIHCRIINVTPMSTDETTELLSWVGKFCVSFFRDTYFLIDHIINSTYICKRIVCVFYLFQLILFKQMCRFL